MVKGSTENSGGSGKQQLNCKIASSLERNKERTPTMVRKISHVDTRFLFLSKDQK